jgi:hypothetical protein
MVVSGSRWRQGGIGSIGSVFGAHAVAHTDAQRSRQAFATSAKDISLLQ